jgi:RNA polymerase sigma-70 factor (ECF subfamily)
MDSTEHSLPTAVAGDPGRAQRFREMADAHTHALYRLALYFTHYRADAEDLVQDTFLRAWRSFDTFQLGTNARAWLATILRNVHLERHRREKRRGVELVDVADIDEWYLYTRVRDADEFQQTDDPAVAFFSTLTSDQVASALQALRPECLEVLALADLEGFSYREISGIVGIPEGTVMSRLYRARHQLQQALWDYCVRTGQCRAPAAAPPRAPQPPACREACRQIYGYLDKTLDAAALPVIDQHLQLCHHCCNRFEFHRRLAATIREARGTAEVPHQFRAGLRAIVARFSRLLRDGAPGAALPTLPYRFTVGTLASCAAYTTSIIGALCGGSG